ncbi:MAG: hypothetical protein KC589_03980 [Nanoarchaeota archaeon]|nr:hypothetical protein [Nanoarchaeota archaeon]
MDSRTIIFSIYALIGLMLILFNRQISDFNYKLVLYFTNKLNLDQLFLFRVDHKNRDSMRVLTRTSTICFGLLIFSLSIYYLMS